MSLERDFQPDLIEELEELFPGCIILKNDANTLQGFPDLLILYGRRWAALETKRHSKSRRRPNQPYYVNLCREMSYGAFVSPENKDQVLREIQESFRSSW